MKHLLNLREATAFEKRPGGNFDNRDMINKIAEGRAEFLGRPKNYRVFSKAVAGSKFGEFSNRETVE